MVNAGIPLLVVAFSLSMMNFAYAEMTTSNQVTLSEDIQNNSIAQDILEKIEKSKRWIAQIEERNFQALEKQKELEKKRVEVLEILERDLKKWESLWEYYTFDKMLERALEKNPAKDSDTIYDHPLKFTAYKINAGRDALQKVLSEGGGPEQARDAFVDAAKITREEMLSYNSLFNVYHNYAYYNQQILFDSDGQFNLELAGEKLRKYYQDFRASPEYLMANPKDTTSWNELSRNFDTQCRDGYVLVYRFNGSDYVCVTESTSEMWLRYGMGKILSNDLLQSNTLSIEKLREDRIEEKIKTINNKIKNLSKYYEEKLVDVEEKYEQISLNLKTEKRDEEKKILQEFRTTSISEKTVENRLENMKEQYDSLEKATQNEKTYSFKILKSNHERDMKNFIKNFESTSDVNIVWNSNKSNYEAVRI